jgi:hypothetical protein
MAAQWRLNNTAAGEFNQTIVRTELVVMPVGNLSSLVLWYTPLEWNNTVIQCVGTFESGAQLSTGRCLLILQGVCHPLHTHVELLRL